MMMERGIDILGMAETRHWGRDRGRDIGGDYTLMYCGTEARGRRHGVAIIVGPRLTHYIQEVKLMSERLLRCTLNINKRKYHIYQVYAPQQGCSEEEKNQFMNEMEEEYKITEEETGVLMGDFNGRVGREREGIERTLGPFGEETRNQEGEKLIDFYVRNSLKIMNGFHQKREEHKYTRYRWNQQSGQLDKGQ